MRLSKLEIQGFKSFAKKTELIISDGVTAVIGPNGSGKSNLSDAIRWALGEQSAKALRGNKMEDVIFNGTAVKHSLSMCSVSLTFNNHDRYLSYDSDEVVITRQAYRSGESNYFINNTDCRLKDILNLFRDTGIGKDGYSIISQGGVDNILSSRTQDRREAIEEAIGVSRYRIRREETVKKLSQATTNIERLEDILHELESRLLPLEKESAKAKVSLSLQNDLKALEINHFITETEKNADKVNSLQNLLSMISEESIENAKEDDLLQRKIHEQEASLVLLESDLSHRNEEQLRLMSLHDSIVSSIKIESERVQSAEEEISRLKNELDELNHQINEYKKIIDSSENDDHSILAEYKTILNNAETVYFSFCASVDAAEKELEQLKSSIMETLNQLSQRRSDKSRLETIRESLNKRNDSIKLDYQLLSEKRESFQKEISDANNSLNVQIKEINDCISEISVLESSQKTVESNRSDALKKLQQAEKKLVEVQSHYTLLDELIRKREGFQNSIRLLMNDAAKDELLSQRIIGLVAEMITVPKQYELAIGTALGSSLQYLIVPTGNDAKQIIEYVREKQYGRITALPLDILRIHGRDSRVNTLLSRPGVIGIASELISAPAIASKAIEYLLGRTLIVETIGCALKLRRENDCYMQIVTLEGDVLQSGGVISGGSNGKRSFDILSRERELSELSEEIKKFSSEKDRLTRHLFSFEKRLKEIDSNLVSMQKLYHDLQIDLGLTKERISIIERDINENTDQCIKLDEEQDSIHESLLEIENKLGQLNIEEREIEKNDTFSKQEIIAKQKAIQELRSQRDQKLKDYTDAKIKFAAVEKDIFTKEKEKQRLLSSIASLESKKESLSKRMQSCFDLSAHAANEKIRLSSESEIVALSSDEERHSIESIQEDIQRYKEEIGIYRHRRDELLLATRTIIEKQSKAEMSIGKLKTQQEQLADSIWQKYELTYENALSYKFSSPVSGMSEKIGSIRRQIREIGPVNPGSIQEFAEVSERYNNLSQQLLDIKNASTDLERLIENLTNTMEKTFKEGFKHIQDHFSAVFAELFGGGKAELRLRDPLDVLNTDIEITAQPPGKKLQLLSLMSGGERALTAIALLFAMLRIKSPSFCVLDEIESSLDEENVNRFASFLKSYGKQTQFIVITHRKGSMEAADSIYGVSMEEKGISTIISAKWEEVV